MKKCCLDAMAGQVLFCVGIVVEVEKSGEMLEIDGPNLNFMGQVRRFLSDRRKIYGLNHVF